MGENGEEGKDFGAAVWDLCDIMSPKRAKINKQINKITFFYKETMDVTYRSTEEGP